MREASVLVSVGTGRSVVWCLSLAVAKEPNGPRERIGKRVTNRGLFPDDGESCPETRRWAASFLSRARRKPNRHDDRPLANLFGRCGRDHDGVLGGSDDTRSGAPDRCGDNKRDGSRYR